MLLGDNVLRAWEQVEKVAKQLQKQGELPNEETWEGRVWEPENFDTPRIFPGV